MQTNWILLIALIAGSSAYRVRPKVTSSPPIPTSEPPAPIPVPEPSAPQNVPNLWRLEFHKEPDNNGKFTEGGRVVINHGKNYAIFDDGRRYPIKLEPVGNNDVIDDTVNKDVDIRLNAPLGPTYTVNVSSRLVDKNEIFEVVEESIFEFIPSQSLVYTSRTSNFRELPLWAIDFGKRLKVITNGNIYQFLFSIRKVSE